MVTEKLINLAKDAGSKNPPKAITKRPSHKFTGWEYVPSIKLYVKDRVDLKGESFYLCKELMHERGLSMLSPLEFWEYYDHCKEKRPDMIEMLKDRGLNSNFNEYLDGLLMIPSKKLIIKPKFEDMDDPVTAGTRYTYDRPLKGRFSRKDIGKHGYPFSTTKDGEFHLFNPELFVDKGQDKYCPCALASTRGTKQIALEIININHKDNPIDDQIGGARYCATEEILRKLIKNLENDILN